MPDRYVWNGKRFVHSVTGEPMIDPDAEWQPVTPTVISDITPYADPMKPGNMITSRSYHRDNLKRHGCRVVEPDEFKPEYHNREFARKRGKRWTPPEERVQVNKVDSAADEIIDQAIEKVAAQLD